jgi:integrase
MARGAVTRWPGGYVRKGVFIIRRTVKGRTYEVSTRARTEAAALQQLARFEADPEAYVPNPPSPALFLDEDLAADFLKWSRLTKGNTRGWVQKQQKALAWWGDELAGKDLRRLQLRADVIEPLERQRPSWKHRARVLKAFYGWLRQEKHLITLAEDPVRGVLRVPDSRPAQWGKSKVIERSSVVAVLKQLEAPFDQAVQVLDGTGWHVSELLRFAGAGAVERGRVLVCPQTKGGSPVRRIVTARTAAAAARLLEHHEGLTHNTLIDALQAASAAAELDEVVLPGRFRHTFATWAVEHGAAPEAVALALDHKSARTTKRFYATLAVRPKVPAPR